MISSNKPDSMSFHRAVPRLDEKRRGAGYLAGALAVLSTLAIAGPAMAYDFTFPAGVACQFDLGVDITSAPKNRVSKIFTDKNGNTIRMFDGGKGTGYTISNVSTGTSLALKGNGAVTTTMVLADGRSLVKAKGHVILIMYSTDIPAGPSTVLYTGQFIYTTDANGVTTLEGSSGTKTDICAALAP